MTFEPTPGEHSAHVPFRRRPFRLIRENMRSYLVINVAAYGLALIGFAIGLAVPELQAAQSASMEADGTGDLVRWLVNTPPLFALTILGVNLFRLSLLTIVVPSLIVPFAGLAFFGYWAVETGITLVPTSPGGWVALIPHSLTLIIELQAYVLLLLGAYLLGRHWLFPRTCGAENRRQGYVRGLRRIGLLALPALVLLIVGAVWEAYSLRYLVYPLSQLLL
ncbi:stage II sporulation protein M [Saccharopolyspora sp. NFXS83]|uniref:stage II sporulation protein M n=1 Tax=Saccharopolyspora sp. NFXS83 TaxID=2993560 RepID=UPI00224AA590|nr:stage II sporulation protein M [Saccharopolyspora sp. NFXS83]MCX2731766.1 stage II sporulation protein M [Saccharopolyspora sp. NFXS83]